jgi:hypothetical protein
LRDEVEECVNVGAREGEFRVEEEAFEEDLSLREKMPIIAVLAFVVKQDGEWDGRTLVVSRGRALVGKGGRGEG